MVLYDNQIIENKHIKTIKIEGNYLSIYYNNRRYGSEMQVYLYGAIMRDKMARDRAYNYLKALLIKRKHSDIELDKYCVLLSNLYQRCYAQVSSKYLGNISVVDAAPFYNEFYSCFDRYMTQIEKCV